MRAPPFVVVAAAAVAVAVTTFASSPALAVDQNQAKLVTELVTAALAKEPKFDVVASADVRKQVELESAKQVAGCSEQASCIAEMAGALGASVVVYGSIGQLDDVIILTLNIFDSSKGQAAGRVVVKEPSLRAVSDKVDGAVHELVAPWLAEHASAASATGRQKLLVLDIDAPKSAGATAGDTTNANGDGGAAKPLNLTLIGGVAGAVVGLALVGGGGYVFTLAADADKQADDLDTGTKDATKLYADRDSFGASSMALMAVGGLVTIGGGVLIAMAVMQ